MSDSHFKIPLATRYSETECFLNSLSKATLSPFFAKTTSLRSPTLGTLTFEIPNIASTYQHFLSPIRWIRTGKSSLCRWHSKIGEETIADAILDRIVHDSYMIEINVNSDEESMRELYGIRRKKTRLMAFSPEWWLKFPGHMALAYRNGGSFWTVLFYISNVFNII